MRTLKYIALAALLLLHVVLLPAGQAPSAIYVDSKGLAISGYDVVSYFTQQKAVKGDARWKAEHHGATFQFSSAENRALFLKSPEKYVPEFGGHCAYSLSRGMLKRCDPRRFSLRDGKLYLFASGRAEKRWLPEQEQLIQQALQHWLRLFR